MKWSAPLWAAALLLLGAAGLWRMAAPAETAQAARTAGAWILERQLGARVQVELREAESEELASPSVSPETVPVETVEEAWDEEAPESEVPAAEVTLAADLSLELRNSTGYQVDWTELPNLPEGLDLDSRDPVVLIVHTHTTEAYTEASSPGVYRSRAEDNGVMAVGDAMAEVLRQRGYAVLHDKTLCDYPEYNGAYTRSRAVIETDLAAYPSICLVLDVHRDAVEDASGGQLAMTAQVGEETAAQLMLVVGTDDGGLEHPDWRQNLSLAAVLQTRMGVAYPGLMRPVNLRSERFNQDLGPLSLLVEVGASGNSLEEALRGARCFSAVLADVLDQYSGKSS